MGGGAVLATEGLRVDQYQGRLTWYVILCVIIGASGGLLFGIDIGISGGVISRDDFQQKFFPSVYERRQGAGAGTTYCQYDDQRLEAFTSSLFLTAAFVGFLGGYLTRRFGRTKSMVLAGISFLVGAGLTSGAVNTVMLVLGRVMLGVGVGLANQSVPLAVLMLGPKYLCEIAPARYRGACNQCFQLATTIGILTAQLVNYGTQYIEDQGWRVSLAILGAPAIILLLGGLCLPETPNSLVERGRPKQARAILERIRGTRHVDVEFEDIVAAAATAAQVKNSWASLFAKRYRPQLIMSILIPFFQQVTGINALTFYSPVFFQTLSFSANAALLSTVIIGVVFVVATVAAMVVVDWAGRRAAFIHGGIWMAAAEIAMAILMALQFRPGSEANKGAGIATIVVVMIFVFAFGASWGPLGWLVPPEIQPLETRSAGAALNVFVQFIFTAVIGQAFLTMLCHMQYGTFLFFAAWVIIMTLFIYFLLPETKGVPIEEIMLIWESHPVWRRFACAPVPKNTGLVDGLTHANRLTARGEEPEVPPGAFQAGAPARKLGGVEGAPGRPGAAEGKSPV